ncbi:MAG: hypothetical protein JSS07_04890 [Proteobacteria bacterium]|nr:hypothetical protein [Pseudomonadota bacterium]
MQQRKTFGELRKKPQIITQKQSQTAAVSTPIVSAADKAPSVDVSESLTPASAEEKETAQLPNPHLMLLAAGIAVLGAFLLASNLFILSWYQLDVAYGGLILLSMGTIGLSHGLSQTFELPKYNLWHKLKDFSKDHLFLCGCTGIGILMVNPWVTLIGFFTGFWLESTEPKLLETTKNMLTKLKKFFSKENRQTLSNNYFESLRNKPLQHICLLIGLALGCFVYACMLPWALPLMISICLPLIELCAKSCVFITKSLLGGYLPSLGLLALTMSICVITFLAPLLLFSASGAWLGFHYGKYLDAFQLYFRSKTVEKALSTNLYFVEKIRATKHCVNAKASELNAHLQAPIVPTFVKPLLLDLPNKPILLQHQEVILRPVDITTEANETISTSNTNNEILAPKLT